MSEMPILRDIENDTPVNAVDVQFNFQTIQTHLDNEVLNRDGSVAMAGPLVLFGAPLSANEAVPKSYADALLPTGMIIDFCGTPTPEQLEVWAVCDGTNVSMTDPKYQRLYAVIGTAYGNPGGGLFGLPNFKGKMSVGRDPGNALFDALGDFGGQYDSELFSHFHSVPEHGHGASGWTGTDGAVDHLHGPYTLSTAGRSAGHTHASNGGHTEVLFRDSGYYTGYAIPTVANSGGGGVAVTWGPLGTESADHAHSVAYGSVGPADRSLAHAHSVGVAVTNQVAFNTVAQGAGTTLTNKNIQPYLTVNKLIKL